MARPSEGLGDAFSCRLPLKYDQEARRLRDQHGIPLSLTVRTWIDQCHKLKSKKGVVPNVDVAPAEKITSCG